MTTNINPSQNTGNLNPTSLQILHGQATPSIRITSPNYVIKFTDVSGKELGKFFINEENKLDFEGSISKAGRKFVDFLKKSFNK
jgi:hypothetical protein